MPACIATTIVIAVAGCTSSSEKAGLPGTTAGTATTQGTSAAAASTAWGTEWTDEQRRSDPPPQLSPVGLRVPFAPTPFTASDDKVHLTYEVETTNTTAATLTVAKVVIANAVTGASIKTYAASEISASMARVGSYWYEMDTLTPGQTGLFFVDLTFGTDAEVPGALLSTVSVTADLSTLPAEVPSVSTPDTSVRVEVKRATVPVIRPPLAGDGWVAFEGCCATRTHHRFASYSLDGNVVVFERYAIDFVRIGRDGQAYVGANKKENYLGYGADLLAVADATVVAALDGLPENEVGEPQPERTMAESMGNNVILDLGGNVYAMYAHLKTGSVTVKVGDKVKAGQVLGQLGNSGQSTNPHLHFHLIDNPTGDLGQGIPWEFTTMSVAGTATIARPETLGIDVDPIEPPSSRTDQYPLTGTIANLPT